MKMGKWTIAVAVLIGIHFGWYVDSCQDAYKTDCAIARNHDSCPMRSDHFLHISDRRVISIWNCSRIGSVRGGESGEAPCRLSCRVVTTVVRCRRAFSELEAVLLKVLVSSLRSWSRVKGAPVSRSYLHTHVSMLATASSTDTRSRKWQVGPAHDLRS